MSYKATQYFWTESFCQGAVSLEPAAFDPSASYEGAEEDRETSLNGLPGAGSPPCFAGQPNELD